MMIINFDEKKLYMLTKLKLFMIYYEYSVIFLTFNSADLHFSISFFYAEKKINILQFHFMMHSVDERLRIMLKNSLAIIKYFHNLIDNIIETILKDNMFENLIHYY